MFSLFADARQGLPLSPAQRAFLKALESFVIAGLVAVLPVLANIFAQDNINWANALRTAAATFAVAVLMSVWKYLKAQGDSPLLSAAQPLVDSAVADIKQWGGIPNDVKQEVVPAFPPELQDEPIPPAVAPAIAQ